MTAPSPLERAIDALYQSPLGSFVAERKRLAAELKAAGDKDGAKTLAAMHRPTISAWAVDQLHWHARDLMDALFDSAERLRKGDMEAQADHRDATAALRARAAEILGDAGHAAAEPTLRKVMSTLAALAAAGGWDPDRPGALAEDREAPGFAGLVGAAFAPRAAAPAHAAHAPARRADPEPAHDRERAEREERERRKAERDRRKAERDRLTFVLKAARAEQHARERELEALRTQVAAAEEAAVQAAATVDDIERQIAALSDDGD